MLFLQSHHITDVFVTVDELLLKQSNALGGRPPVLSDSELVTILLWDGLVAKHKLLKDIWTWVRIEHEKEFPHLPSYPAFVDHCHRILPQMTSVLQALMQESALVFADSTFLEVSTLQRADHHKVVKGVADFGKNHQGWHFGFKLHAAIHPNGQLSSLLFTPGNIYDAQALPRLVKDFMKILVGDSHYGASVMKKQMWEQHHLLIVAPPHYKQKRKLMTAWQQMLLRYRPKIETVFDYAKQHLGLVISFPRSIAGYFVHYIRILLAYQICFSFNGGQK